MKEGEEKYKNLINNLKKIIIDLEKYDKTQNGDKDKHILHLVELLTFQQTIAYLQYLYNDKYSTQASDVLYGAKIYRLYKSIK